MNRKLNVFKSITRNLDPGSYTYMFHEVKKMCSWPNNFWKYICIPSSYTLFVSIHKAVGTLHWKGLFDFFLLICLKAHFLWQTKRIVWLFFLIHLKAHFFMSNTHEYPLPLVIHRHHLYKPWSTERVKIVSSHYKEWEEKKRAAALTTKG